MQISWQQTVPVGTSFLKSPPGGPVVNVGGMSAKNYNNDFCVFWKDFFYWFEQHQYIVTLPPPGRSYYEKFVFIHGPPAMDKQIYSQMLLVFMHNSYIIIQGCAWARSTAYYQQGNKERCVRNIIAAAFAVGNISEHFVKDSESKVFKIFWVEGCQVVQQARAALGENH